MAHGCDGGTGDTIMTVQHVLGQEDQILESLYNTHFVNINDGPASPFDYDLRYQEILNYESTIGSFILAISSLILSP